ncbi:MAG: lysophospholipid acyltransferase family protein [Elusimicrobiota bacterium]
MKALKKLNKTKTVKILRHFLLIEVLVSFLVIVVLLPYKVSLLLGRYIGFLVCYTAVRYKKVVENNLRMAFPEYSYKEIIRIRDDVFRNVGMNFVEFALLNFRSREFWLKKISIRGKSVLDKNLNKGSGIVMVSAHIGNWELMGAYLSMRGYPLTVIAREVYEKRLNWLLKNMRMRMGIKTIGRDGKSNMRKMIATVRKGEILGILIDQDTRVGGVFVDFFGMPAYTPTAVSQFARVKNSVVVPGFMFRKKDLSHEVILMEPVPGGVDEIKETQEYTAIIESMIRKEPAQWVWMHPRWKTQPC